MLTWLGGSHLLMKVFIHKELANDACKVFPSLICGN